MAARHKLSLATLVLLFSLLFTLTFAAKATSFCKCTCGSNSTIIALRADPPNSEPSMPPSNDNNTDYEPPPRKTGTCTDCNRGFCLEKKVNDLRICSDTKDDQIFTECFQRDSAKDEAVIYAFIVITVGLLGWSLIRPWIKKRVETVQERRSYVPVPLGQGSN